MADRISSLPNEVLCHILSFLPTKASVATCVLSKRWKLLWRSVPALYFDDSGYDDDLDDCEIPYSRFVLSVYAFIISRDLDQPLRRFSLRCICLGDYMNANAWLTAAVQRSVEFLHLSRCLSVDFPSALHGCKTLVILKLKDLNVRSLSSVNIPSLKTLHLNRVHFLERKFLAELLAGAPNLEDLEAKEVSFRSHEIEAKFIRLPKLVRAVIVRFRVPLEVVDNVQFMLIKSIDEELIDIEDRIPEFNNLTHLEIGNLEYTQDWLEVLEVLKHCPKLQNFAINENSIEEWFSEGDEGNWHQPQHVPQCISQNLKTCCLNDYGDFEAEFEIAKYIMKNARHLQDMTIRSFNLANEPAKLEMLTKLSLCTRLSPNCKLSFN